MSSYKIPPEVLEELTHEFSTIDLDGNGHLTVSELGQAFQMCGENVPGYKLRDLIREHDLDENGTIDFKEFMAIMGKLHDSKSANQFRNMVKKRQDIQDYGAASVHANTDIKHSVSAEEQRSFSDWINRTLGDDKDLASYLPLTGSGDDIYKKSRDGVLLCKVINQSAPDTIDERAINKGKLNVFLATENLNLAINSARSIGCNVVNIGYQDIAEEKPHLVLGLLWQLIKMGLLSKINLTTTTELAALLREGETLEDLMRLSPEQLLIRWVNYQMEQAGCPRRISNFSGDISDSEVYGYLLPQIAPAEKQKDMHRPLNVIETGDHLRRASMVVQNAEKLDASYFVTPKDIVSGNAKLNLAFVANLFNNYPALHRVENMEEMIPVEETREEKTYRNWMNSLGVDPFVNHLYSDIISGLILFQIYDSIKSGYVEWKRVNKTFSGSQGRFKKIENCNYAVELGKGLKFSLVGIGGEDIYSENRTLTMALIWQMMRAYTLSILNKLSGVSDRQIKDAEIVEWANNKLKEAGKSTSIRNFKDSSISTSHVVLDLIDAIRPGVIRADLVEDGSTDESRLANAKYAISCARKTGAQVYALPEDLVEVNPKMTLTVFACLMTLARQLQTNN